MSYTINKPKTETNNIRKAVYAGSFYPANKEKLVETIKNLINKTKQNPPNLPTNKKLKALIFPHAGYIYSGLTAAYSASLLKKESFDEVILMGPDHKIGFKNCSISSADAYQTPLGQIPLNKDKIKSLTDNSEIFQYIKASDTTEHSLEVILPFLITALKKFKLIPIVMGNGNILEYAPALNRIADKNSLIVASADLSHYLDYDQAVKKDKKTIKNILDLNSEQLIKGQNNTCGIIPILTLIEIAKKNNWTPVFLHYSNSGDTAGNKDQVVGYGAIAFYENAEEKSEQNKKKLLLKLARETIESQLEKTVDKPDKNLEAELKKHPPFNKIAGTFVTLHINNRLRGCIGNIVSDIPIIEGVKSNAINAAFKDTRFAPLTKKELDITNIEISLLTEPKPLIYKDENDLISKLKHNKYGVILRKGIKSATFLPQVWDQLPEPKNFLSHLCAKAGLPPNAWIKDKPDIFIYKAEHFEE
ncbi:MAG: AmmeMemoRadiSam system protein B [Deltaproteobacteria bacterium]|nr:AmmeMemoRadiSam system protein B [Deltaproteobacteria bacterium]